MILRKLKMDVEAYLGENVTDTVITVSGYFKDIQRQAARDAGLNGVLSTNQPVPPLNMDSIMVHQRKSWPMILVAVPLTLPLLR